MIESGTLQIYRLTVESSYAENFERPATGIFDTIQWWIGNNGGWRIKTYAVDSDIHPHRLNTSKSSSELLELAKASTEKTYGDIIGEEHTLEITEGTNDASIREILRNEGLSEEYEWVDSGYLLWLPSGSELKTKTIPKKVR